MPLAVGFIDAKPILEKVHQASYQRCMVLTVDTFLMQYRVGENSAIIYWNGMLNGLELGCAHATRIEKGVLDVTHDFFFMDAIDNLMRSAYADIKKLARMQTGQQW